MFLKFYNRSKIPKKLAQSDFPTFLQKREIFERRTRKSKLALEVIFFLSRPIGAVFGMSSLFYHYCGSI